MKQIRTKRIFYTSSYKKSINVFFINTNRQNYYNVVWEVNFTNGTQSLTNISN